MLTDPTVEETGIMDRHFERLKRLFEEGTVHMAGPALDGEFGIVVFEAEDEGTAVSIMNDDPAVVAGVMTAELHPFRISLERQP
jgi:uncharacterized protein YciI